LAWANGKRGPSGRAPPLRLAHFPRPEGPRHL